MGKCRREGFVEQKIPELSFEGKMIRWNGEAFLGNEKYFHKVRL